MLPLYIINLKDRVDRYDAINKELKKSECVKKGIIVPNFLRVDKHPKGGVYGCWNSHMKIFNMLLNDKNHNYYMIFEDDATLLNDFDKKILMVTEWMEKHPFWMIKLTHPVAFVNDKSHMRKSIVQKAISGYSMCAYIISKDYVKTIYNRVKSAQEFDKLIEGYGSHIDLEMANAESPIFCGILPKQNNISIFYPFQSLVEVKMHATTEALVRPSMESKSDISKYTSEDIISNTATILHNIVNMFPNNNVMSNFTAYSTIVNVVKKYGIQFQ